MTQATDVFDILSKEQVNFLAKNYNPLDYTPTLQKLLSSACEGTDFTTFTKIKLHETLNEILLKQRLGEPSLKYELFRRAANQKLVAAFEIRVGNSRADFLTVNGVSTSFEIKSSLDNLDKLSKQAADYLLAFEYNYVVIDKKHLDRAEKILPASFGIWSFKSGRKTQHRKASINNQIDPLVQLSLLTKKEIIKAFNTCTASEIIKKFADKEINTAFKQALKDRYRKRWEFIVTKKNEIMPIDLQFFFNTNVLPEYIYQYG